MSAVVNNAVAPLPLSTLNVVLGATSTAVSFVVLMTWTGAFLGGPIGFVVAVATSGIAAGPATLLLGVPLTLLAARLLRSCRSVWNHLLAQFSVGAVAAGLGIGLYAAFLKSTGNSTGEGDLYFILLIVIPLGAGVSSVAGWGLALFAQTIISMNSSTGVGTILNEVHA